MGKRGATFIYNSETIIYLKMELPDVELTIASRNLGVLSSHAVLVFESIMTSKFSQQRNIKSTGRAKFRSVTFKMLSGDNHPKTSSFRSCWPFFLSSLATILQYTEHFQNFLTTLCSSLVCAWGKMPCKLSVLFKLAWQHNTNHTISRNIRIWCKCAFLHWR